MKNQILLLTHGSFAKGLQSSIKVITGEEDKFEIICLMESDSVDLIKSKINNWIKSTSNDKPKLILTDIPFGSTTSLSAPFIENVENLHIISGLNLALVLTLITQEITFENINEIIKESIEQAKESVCYINNKININDEGEDDF